MSAPSPAADALPVALITGASTGIGAATAAHFAARGWRVFATARTPARVVAGPNVTPLALDVRDPDSVRAAVAGVLADAGRVDALVNNAGYAVAGGLEETSAAYADARDRVIGVITAGVAGGATPEGVAAVIHEAATARHPRLRYPAGRDAAVLDALRRLLPERLFSRALRRQFALDVAGS